MSIMRSRYNPVADATTKQLADAYFWFMEDEKRYEYQDNFDFPLITLGMIIEEIRSRSITLDELEAYADK